MGALLIALKYFPYVIQAVVAIEQAIGSQPGATKKQVMIGSVTAAAGGPVDESHLAVIARLIDTVVSALNASGALGKSIPPPPPKPSIPATPSHF